MAGILDFEILEDGRNFKIPLKIISKDSGLKISTVFCASSPCSLDLKLLKELYCIDK